MVNPVRQITLILRLCVTPALLSALLILRSADTSHAINLGLVDGSYSVTLDVTNDPSVQRDEVLTHNVTTAQRAVIRDGAQRGTARQWASL